HEAETACILFAKHHGFRCCTERIFTKFLLARQPLFFCVSVLSPIDRWPRNPDKVLHSRSGMRRRKTRLISTIPSFAH
ncbi:MAG: hypothetical protein PUD50_08400, partial [Eubacteriales bacterium]|nr:hypothetical protein [Eubacteriales bacterium]